MYEVEAGQIAESRSTSGAVKAFAAKMVEAHTATTTQLKGILASTNQTSLAPSALDTKHKGQLEQLKKVAAAQFDTTYTEQQVQAHEDAVTLFTGYSQNGQDPQIKKFAADTLPTIQQHLDMARQLSASH
jgi:putative membrane protein